MQIEAEAILWRKWNQATFDTLHGNSPGQYDIRLNKHTDLDDFFEGLQKSNPTPLGGYDIVVPIEAISGANPEEPSEIVVRYMGPSSKRNDWYIRSQRPDTAYPRWRPGQGVPSTFDSSLEEYALVIRDKRGKFHCRWIHDDEVSSLPNSVTNAMRSADVGWEVIG